MITEIGSRLRITNPSPDMVDWCKKHLEIPNPEYQKKARMNLWLGDTPRTLVMYEVDGDSVIIPFGCLRSILPLLEGDVKKLFAKQVKVDYKGAKVPLYDYQKEAVGAMIINHCDTADTGDDFCAMPIAAVYGSEVYIVDVVLDDSAPKVTKPECAKALIDNKVVASTFESNNAGKYFARDVQQILTDRKYVCNIRTKQTISNKQTRIEFASDNILKKFYFKDPSLYARNSQYAAFLKQVTTYTRSGKVPHDDAPDSLALLENELRGLIGNTVEIMDRRI